MFDNERAKVNRQIIMKCWLIGGSVLGGLSMLYMQVRVQGLMPVAKTVIAINLFYSSAWLLRAKDKDIVLFKRSKLSDTKTTSNSV